VSFNLAQCGHGSYSKKCFDSISTLHQSCPRHT
jgi:hypothetical protein